MDKNLEEQVLELLSKYHDESISDEEMTCLEQLILENDEVKVLAVQMMDLNAELTLQSESVIEEAPSKKSTKAPLAFFFALAALLIIGLFIQIPKGTSTQNSASTGLVAIVSDSQGANWQKFGSENRIGHAVTPGLMILKEGKAELTFTNGARVKLQGPAKLDIIDEMSIKLSYGKLSAHITEEAKGFTVDTSDVRVVDLGTEFAVNLPQNGEAEVHVFSGLVQTESIETDEIKSIYGKQSVRYSKSEKSFETTEFSKEKFITPPKFKGIPKTTGNIKYLQNAPATVALKTYQHNYIIAFPEKELTLSKPLTVSGVLPGRQPQRNAKGNNTFDKKSVQAGTTLKSFMVHFDCHTKTAVYSYGSITFPYPIIGYIPTRKGLLDTDSLLGNEETNYADQSIRGLDAGRTKASQVDHMVLSEDRKTLILSWHNSIAIDQVRVLVEVPDNPKE